MKTTLKLKDITINPVSLLARTIADGGSLILDFEFTIEGIKINESVMKVLLMTDEFEEIIKSQTFSLIQTEEEKIKRIFNRPPKYYDKENVLRISIKSNHQFSLIFNSNVGGYKFDELHRTINNTNITKILSKGRL